MVSVDYGIGIPAKPPKGKGIGLHTMNYRCRLIGASVLVIVDLGLEGCDGLDLIKEMKHHHPGTPAMVLSMHDESLYAERALRAGARGHVTKQQLDETVLIAIRRLLK